MLIERVAIRRWWYVVCLVLVLCGAGAIRIFRLNAIPVDSDEAVTLSWLAEPTCWKMLRSVAADLVNQPLYPLLLRLWRDIRGDSVPQLRELSVFFGWAAVAFSPFLLRRRAWPGLMLAGYVAVLPIHVQFSQRLRAYGLLLCLATLQLAIFQNWSTGGRKRGVLLAVVTCLGMYCHVVFVFLVAGEVLVLLLQRKTSSTTTRLWALTVGVLAFAPWAVASLYFREQGMANHAGWIPRPYPDRLGGIASRLVVGAMPSLAVKWILAWVSAIGAIGVATYHFMHRLVSRKREERRLLIMAGVPVGLVLAASCVLPFSLAIDRYFLALLPAISLSVIRGLYRTRFHGAALWGLLILDCLILTLGNPPGVGAYEP